MAEGSTPPPSDNTSSDQPIIYDIKAEVESALNGFYYQHVEGNLQIFHSLTLGEIVISILLAAIILLIVFRWIWEALRY